MKQRCAILDCDYFQGGECRGLCSLGPRPPRTISIQPADVPAPTRSLAELPPLHIDVAEPDPEPQQDHQPDDEDQTVQTIITLVALTLALGMVLFAAKLGHLLWLAR